MSLEEVLLKAFVKLLIVIYTIVEIIMEMMSGDYGEKNKEFNNKKKGEKEGFDEWMSAQKFEGKPTISTMDAGNNKTFWVRTTPALAQMLIENKRELFCKKNVVSDGNGKFAHFKYMNVHFGYYDKRECGPEIIEKELRVGVVTRITESIISNISGLIRFISKAMYN